MSDDLDILLEALPPDSRESVRGMWSGLPADMRRELRLTLSGFVKLLRGQPGTAQDLLKLIRRLSAPVINPVTRVAIVGPVNVGKSTLFNAMVPDPSVHAEVSPIPGTTRLSQSSEKGLFSLVDTPGADNGAPVGTEEKEKAFDAAMAADFLLIVFDATVGISSSGRVLYGELIALNKPYLVVLNKIDLVAARHRAGVVRSAAQVLKLNEEMILPVSAHRGTGIEQLMLELAAAEPRLLGKLGDYLTPLRRKLGWQAIRRAAVASGLVALTPIPLTDVVPLTVIQGTMVLTLARVYGQEVGWTRGLEILASFGAGLLGRAAFQQLSKLGGIPGWALSASIAVSGTVTIGYAVMIWFETGRKATHQDMVAMASGLQKSLVSRLSGKKPGKEKLTSDLEHLLPELTGELDPADKPEEESTSA
ncbi:MAG: GTPase [Candidatus Eremiobacterota bacterium]